MRLPFLFMTALLFLGMAASAGLAEPRTIVDGAGREVEIDDTSRVVALGGSVTEILYALGLEDRIAAIDTTSLYPPRALGEKPNVGYLRALSAEGVLSLDPSLVLAEEDAGPVTTVAILERASVPFLIVPGDKTAAGTVAKLRFIGDVMGVAEEGAAMADALAHDFAALEKELSAVEKPMRALFVLSLSDGRILAAGSDTSAEAILTLAGVANVFAGEFQGYRPVNAEAVLSAAPDAIVVMARQGGGDGPGVAVADILAHPILSRTPAGQAQRVVGMDGLYLLGFGPRTAHAAHDLAAVLYPDLALPELAARPWTAPSAPSQ